MLPSKLADLVNTTVICKVLKETAYRKVILRSDNEPAIMLLKEKVRAMFIGAEDQLSESRVGDHNSNGTAEAAVRLLLVPGSVPRRSP